MGSATLELVRGHASPLAAPTPAGSSQRLRIVEGALACIARQGLAKTTLDDVARAAGYSRATVYRAFPGGKDAVTAAVADTEVSRLFSELAVRMGNAPDLEAVLVEGMTCAATRISSHEALAFLLEHEPEVVLPHLTFEHHDEVLATAAAFVAPFLGRWLAHDQALRVAELTTRIVLSYLACPAQGIDLADHGCARHIVRTYVLPGIRASAPEAGLTEPINPRIVPVTGPTASKGEAS
ncbi:MAG: TetR/AcrR family transcriptional regulator [Acidimicrobiales bacterium]